MPCWYYSYQLHLSYGNDGATDPRLLNLIQKVPTELWGAKLALQLLAHRIRGSRSDSINYNTDGKTNTRNNQINDFAPYIAALPLGFPGLPMFFPPDAIAALEYPPVTEQVKRRCRWLLSFASESLAPIRGNEAQDPFEGVEIDANALGWALAAVTSRAFRTRGPDQPAAMLPLIDMANHSFDPNAKITGQGGTSGAFQMVSTKEIQAGDPILLSYGNLVNDFLLLDYGFIVPDNPYDTVQLRFDRILIEAAKAVANVGSATNINNIENDDELGVSPLSALPAWQEKALESLGLAGPGANTEVSIIQLTRTKVKAPVDARLLAGVRILCAANASEVENAKSKNGSGGTSKNLDTIKSAIEAFGAWERPLSLRNEVATLKTLSGVALIALSQFSTTEDDDIKLLKKSSGSNSSGNVPLSADMLLAVRFRLEKKRLLSNALEALAARLKTITEEGAGVAGGGDGNGVDGRKSKKENLKTSLSKGFGR
jgi:Rubisco LSMT substrate-binding/SET domain